MEPVGIVIRICIDLLKKRKQSYISCKNRHLFNRLRVYKISLHTMSLFLVFFNLQLSIYVVLYTIYTKCVAHFYNEVQSLPLFFVWLFSSELISNFQWITDVLRHILYILGQILGYFREYGPILFTVILYTLFYIIIHYPCYIQQ
jgi:hypothetical protein